MPHRVVVQGATGKMGREVLAALCREPEFQPVGAVARRASADALPLPDGKGTIPLSADLEDILHRTRPQVLVDFSTAEGARNAARIAPPLGINLVIGSSGLTPADLSEIADLAQRHNIGAVVAANFALGAVVMMHLARIAAKYFDYAEVIEMHHHGKSDAPSGTALATAREMVAARGQPFKQATVEKHNIAGTRGGEIGGIAIHALRLPGLMAHQEIILGTAGQTLTLRHDTINRECYIPGLLIALREVTRIKGLVVGLDKLLGL